MTRRTVRSRPPCWPTLPPTSAMPAWAQLLRDPSRMVRRSVVDVVVGADREATRSLLEQALDDTDAWVRWKALRGIAALGVGCEPPRRRDPRLRPRLPCPPRSDADPLR